MVAPSKLATPPASSLPGFREQLIAILERGDHDGAVSVVMLLLEKLSSDNQQLAHRLGAALRTLYRSKSEKVSADQLALFLAQLPDEDAAKAEITSEPEPVTPASDETGSPSSSNSPQDSATKKKGRKPLPAHLRREIRPIAVPQDQRQCGTCGHAKQPMGHESQLRLEYKPPEFFIIEEQLEIIVCKCCAEGVVTAPASPKPIEGGRPGPGLLAQIVTAKLRDCIPLYRQSQIYRRSGIDLAPSTLGDWFGGAADEAKPLADHLREDALVAYLLSLDDTGLPVLDRDHPRGVKRGHIWTFIADAGRVAFCAYTPDWKGARPAQILSQFRGQMIQGDGYAGLDDFFTRPRRFGDVILPPPKRAGCMDHARRRFVHALEAGDARAAVPVALFRQLYAVEAASRAAGDDLDALRHRRQTQSQPILTRIQQVIVDLYGRAVPKSLLGKAITYAIHQWPTLHVFVDDPRVPISNILVERMQRRPVLARKNFLFSGSDEGAERIAILQTLAVNCELVEAPLFEYLRDTFDALAGRVAKHQLADLTPAAWLAKQPRQ